MEKTNQTIHEAMKRNKILKHSVRTKYLDFCNKVLLISAISEKLVIAIKYTTRNFVWIYSQEIPVKKTSDFNPNMSSLQLTQKTEATADYYLSQTATWINTELEDGTASFVPNSLLAIH